MRITELLRPAARRTWRRRLAVVVLGLGLVTTSSWGVEPAPGDSIFPQESPRGLTDEDFESLDGEWAEWAAGASARVNEFYAAADPAARAAALDSLKVKLGTMEKALKDPKYRAIQAPLERLYGRLNRRIILASAVVDTLTLDADKAAGEAVASAVTGVNEALASVRKDLKSVPGGEAWLPYIHAEEVGAIASKKDGSPEAVKVLKQVQGNIANRGSLPEDQRKFLERDSFQRLAGAVDALAAAFTAPTGDAAKAKLNENLAKLVSAVERYENDGTEVSTQDVRNSYLLLTQSAPDGGARLTAGMREAYFNYNLRVYAGEKILQRLFSDTRRESSWINQYVMEAHVRGYQCLNTTVGVDVIPSGQNARFNIIVTGDVSVNSTASVPQATIYSRGYHTFRADKPVWTDGKRFQSSPASVSVAPSTQITGASTKADWIPIFRRVARNIALNEANSRRGQANSYTANQIRSEVMNKMNSEVGAKFDNSAYELETKVYGPLRELGLYPDALDLSSTDSLIELRSRVMNADELGANLPAPGVVAIPDEMLLQVHESLLNNGTDRVGFNGKEMTESQVKETLQARFKKLLGDKFKFPAKKQEPGAEPQKEITFLFDQEDPIRFKIEEGEVQLQMRTGMRREGQEDIPAQLIIIPLKLTVVGDEILLDRGKVSVKPIPGRRVTEAGMQITRANVMRQNIESTFQSQKLKGTFELGKERKITMRITSIDSEAGWVTVRLK
jgi:hypothetical protein